jgi:LysM repeat protein
MDSRAVNWFFGLLTLGAIGFAAYIYLEKADTAQPSVTSSIAPVGTTSSPSSSLSPKASVSPTVSPSTSPSPATTRAFTATQPLSQPNETATIESGGSLYSIAAEQNITVKLLSSINGISNPDSVFAGQKIIIPDDVGSGSATILYVLNPKRLEREQAKIASGSTSLYSSAITAAQSDAKGIAGIANDTPFSQTLSGETAATLTTTNDIGTITLGMEKDASGLWLLKKLTLKLASST